MITKEELEKLSTDSIQSNQELFKKVQEICDDLISTFDVTNIRRYAQHQDILTGIYGTLSPIYKRLRALKENYEAERFNQLKLEADVNGDKFVAEVAKRNASAFVSELRLSRDILEGYINSCAKAIDTCKTHIYDAQKEKKYDV